MKISPCTHPSMALTSNVSKILLRVALIILHPFDLTFYQTEKYSFSHGCQRFSSKKFQESSRSQTCSVLKKFVQIQKRLAEGFVKFPKISPFSGKMSNFVHFRHQKEQFQEIQKFIWPKVSKFYQPPTGPSFKSIDLISQKQENQEME